MTSEYRNGSVTLPFADDDYVLRLAWTQLEELQEKCSAGPYVVLDRLLSGRWLVGDVSEVIRLGLIGGGMEPIPALKLVRRYVMERPPLESVPTAQLALGRALAGAPEEELEKKSEAANQKMESVNSPTESSDLPPFTEAAPPRDSHRKR